MKKQILLMALGSIALGCGSDPTSANLNPDPSACSKGSISPGDVKNGAINSSSCVRYDHAYTEDSMPFDSYSFTAVKGKGYWFALDAANETSSWDAVLEVVTVDPSTNEEHLLYISDDEGPGGYSRMAFIAPVSGTFYIRAAGYGLSDTSAYKLTAKSCDSPIPTITGTLTASAQTLSTTDCVLAEPEFVDDSSHIKLFSVQLNPNETKTVTITSTAFVPALQVYGPGWGLSCRYQYQGCGGGVAGVNKSNTESVTINASGNENCGLSLVPPDQNGPLASRVSAAQSHCEFYDWPGLYTITVGTFFNESGAFTLDVTEGVPVRLVGPDVIIRNPTLEFLRKKPFNASHYLRRVS